MTELVRLTGKNVGVTGASLPICLLPYPSTLSYAGKWVTVIEKAAYCDGCKNPPRPPKKRYAVKNDTEIIALRQPESVDDADRDHE